MGGSQNMSPELQAAMQRRSGNPAQGATAQVSQGAPTADPATQTPMQPTASAATAGAPATASMPFDPGIEKMIVGSLTNHLRSINKLRGA